MKTKLKEKESDIVKAILTFLAYKKIPAWRNNSGMVFLNDKKYGRRAIKMGKAGVSDIIGCLPNGRILCLEVKTAKGQPTELQADFLAEIIRNKGVAGIVRSIEDVEELLK